MLVEAEYLVLKRIFYALNIVSCRNKLKTRGAAMKISCFIQSEKFILFYLIFFF